MKIIDKNKALNNLTLETLRSSIEAVYMNHNKTFTPITKNVMEIEWTIGDSFNEELETHLGRS